MRLTSVFAVIPLTMVLAAASASAASAADGDCLVGDGAAYSTIQSAVDDPRCDTVYVAPTQEYHENVSITRSLKVYGLIRFEGVGGI
jgi:hypothetical protein